MKAITLRNLPPEVAKTVQQRAKQKKTSVNKAVIELLEESVGDKVKKKEKVRYHDLDHLAGTWSKEEAEAFEKLIAEQRTIDPELWK
ncbi:MAG: hypothetical protein AABZ22_01335 [Nitrospirota bacterium]